MQGMLSQAQQGAGQAMPGRQVPVGPQAPAQPQGQSPQQPQPQSPGQPQPQQGKPEQGMYDVVVGQAAEWIYGEGLQSVQQRLQVSEDPAQDIGDVVGSVLIMSLTNAAEAGKSIPPQVMVQAAMELSSVVAELSLQLGRMTEQDVNRETVEAFFEAMTKLGNGAKKILSQEQNAEYQNMINGIIAAEQDYMVKSQQQPQGNNPVVSGAAGAGNVAQVPNGGR